MEAIDNPNEYILTENSGTFTITHNPKMDNVSSSTETSKIMEADDDIDEEESQIIEDYSSDTEQLIEMDESVVATTSQAAASANSQQTVANQIKKQPKLKKIKVKPQSFEGTTFNRSNEVPSCEANDLKINNFDSFTTAESFVAIPKMTPSGHDALDAAVEAVLNEGLSLQKAAVKFEVSKTVLWRRVRKHPNYMKTARENPILTIAYEKLKSGESLKAISKQLDIPMSTLHRHKVRLAQQGRLPDYITFKKRDPNTKDILKEKLKKAVQACIHEGMSQNHAANLFNIPKSTLWRHLQKRVADSGVEKSDSEEIKVVLN